jgi:hypothetical protein
MNISSMSSDLGFDDAPLEQDNNLHAADASNHEAEIMPLNLPPNGVSELQVHSFQEVFPPTQVRIDFKIIPFQQCLWIWLSDIGCFRNLSVAIFHGNTLSDSVGPVSGTCLLEDISEGAEASSTTSVTSPTPTSATEWGDTLARRLALRTKRMCYVSYNLSQEVLSATSTLATSNLEPTLGDKSDNMPQSNLNENHTTATSVPASNAGLPLRVIIERRIVQELKRLNIL